MEILKPELKDIALRAYAVQQSPAYLTQEQEETSTSDVVAVIDTETTIDAYQNLRFGSCGIWVADKLHRFIIFYSESLSRREIQVLREYAEQPMENLKAELIPIGRLVDEVFYPVVYEARAMLVGFNLPFDLSRLAIRHGFGKRKWKGGFAFTLSKNRFRPPIRIKSIDSTKAFIEFCKPSKRNQRHPRRHYRGRFLDLRTLGFALTNKKLTLAQACRLFQTNHQKTETEEHGKTTPEYVAYNVNDTLATYDLYLKMLQRHESFHLALPAERAYSPASIGKRYLRQMGIKPFLEQNRNFPPEVLGYVMTTFYGGRSEVRIRKKPVKVRYLDFTSMYPSLFSLMNLWPYLIAERIECVEATAEIRRLVEGADLETLRDPELWRNMVAIVQIQPDGDVLPVRSHYGDKQAWNIGISHLKCSSPLWYGLPDVIASGLLNGKSPKIVRAIKFVPQGKQTGLSPIQIVGGQTVYPEEDLFRKLCELRKCIQKKGNQRPKDSLGYQALDIVQEELKIIANAASYGIFIEVNTEDRASLVDVHGLESFTTKASKQEKFAHFFHPIVSSMLASGARLLLAMAETWLQHGGYYAFCDTDSIAVSPFHWKKLQQYFQPLSPIPAEDFLKVEKENRDENGKLRDLWFYGISAKRYVLYYLDAKGDPDPVKWSSHGLGHLLHTRREEWEKQLWGNILRHPYGRISKTQLLEQYANEYAVSKLAITTPILLRRIGALNKGRSAKQIKPYNFVLVGQFTMTSRSGNPIIPLTPFTSEYGQAPYQFFVDTKSGRLYEENTELYWKTLDKAVEEYIDHPETKFENGHRDGTMRPRHLLADSIRYIGKESNELEETEALGVDDETYREYRKIQ